MQPKSKGELLIQRLQKIKQNSEVLMKKMDNKINSMQEVKDDLDGKSQRMTTWTNRFQNLIHEMGEAMVCNNTPLVRAPGEPGPKIQSVSNICSILLKAKSICILTGAGVSKSSGIPTFRDKNGLYSNKFTITSNEGQSIQCTPQQFLTLETFQKYPHEIWKWCDSLKKLVAQKNPGSEHQIINQICLELYKSGINICLVTTNIDSLHYKTLLRNKADQQYQLYEIHGNFRKYLCFQCRNSQSIDLSQNNFSCSRCHSTKLRPFIMFFDEKYDQIFDPSNLRNKQNEVTIVIGTSLQTGLSVKIVSKSQTIIQINPKCVIQSGNVYHFQKECEQVLAKLLTQLKIARTLKK